MHQAVALGADGLLGQKTIASTAVGWTELLQWASTWSERIWAVEGSGSLGRGVAQFLACRGERVHEVNPRCTAQRRRGLRRPGKSDALDAQAVARLLREESESLPLVQPETVVSASLQLWGRLRDDVVLYTTRLRNRLHAFLLLSLQAVLHTRNVTQAGAWLGVTQPAMSSDRRRVREMFQDDLLVRSGREYPLTALATSLEEGYHVATHFRPG